MATLNDILKRTGISLRTFKYYRELSLLPRPIGIRGTRQGVRYEYGIDTIPLIKLIQEMSTHLTLREIRQHPAFRQAQSAYASMAAFGVDREFRESAQVWLEHPKRWVALFVECVLRQQGLDAQTVAEGAAMWGKVKVIKNEHGRPVGILIYGDEAVAHRYEGGDRED